LCIRDRPSQRVLERTMTGSYAQHAQAIAAIIETAGAQANGPVIGIYPYDPSTVREQELVWMLAIPVEPPMANLAALCASGYEARVLPGLRAAVVDTTVADSRNAGLYLLKWLPANGWAQAGPTRMVFGTAKADASPTEMSARIEVPIRSLLP
jgi:hypothetical protein